MNSSTPAFILSRFKHHLNEIICTHGLYSFLDEADGPFNEELPLDRLISNNINVETFVESITMEAIHKQISADRGMGNEPGKRLLIAPCSPLFEGILQDLADNYPKSIFIDTNRAGLKIGEKVIVHPSKVSPGDHDFCLILTRNTDACESYEKKFGQKNCFNALREFVNQQKREIAKGTEALLEKINHGEKPILFASARPMATLNSTMWKMQQDGYETFWLGSEDVKAAHQTGYATPKVKDLALTDYSIGSLIDFIFTFVNMQQGVVLYHYETIYPPGWDFKRIAICYAATLAMIRTVKECRSPKSSAKLGLYMYDAIKPGVKNYSAGKACGDLYKLMMKEAEAIIFSSFTRTFGEFVENAVGKTLPRVHHHRYQTLPSRRRPRLKDGYHIAVISVLLEDFWEPSRVGLIPYIRNIIAQGIHIHYYVANNSRDTIDKFQQSLPENQRHFFHVHTPIHNLEELANELSQYHVGWSLFNMQIFSDMVANLTDQFMRDAMDLFTPTTLPSVIWTCAAAGLPVICNRSMSAVKDMLPEGMTLPLTLSVLNSLPRILDEIDWTQIDQIPLNDLDISNHIHKLYRFLDGYFAEKPEVL